MPTIQQLVFVNAGMQVPDRCVHPDGTPYSQVSCEIISCARNDSLSFAMHREGRLCPYTQGSVSQRMWSDTLHDAFQWDETPYPKDKRPLYPLVRR